MHKRFVKNEEGLACKFNVVKDLNWFSFPTVPRKYVIESGHCYLVLALGITVCIHKFLITYLLTTKKN